MFARGNETERFFIPAHGADDDALKAGFAWLLAFCGERGITKAGVFVSSLRQVESLGRVIGDGAARALEKDREVGAGSVTIHLLLGTKQTYSFDGPILAVWVDDKQLDELDELHAPGLLAIPWNSTDIDGWKTNWNPTDPRTGDQGGSDDTVTNPVVVAALQSLTNGVNLSTGVGHPSDKASAVQMFKLLTKAGEPFDPEQIRAWAARNGWKADHARDLSEMAQKILAGRTVRDGRQGQMWRDDIVEQWRAAAAGDE